jgi:hypothetical protein
MKSWIDYADKDIKDEIASRRCVIREYRALLKKQAVNEGHASRIIQHAHIIIDDANQELAWRKTQ